MHTRTSSQNEATPSQKRTSRMCICLPESSGAVGSASTTAATKALTRGSADIFTAVLGSGNSLVGHEAKANVFCNQSLESAA